MKRRQGGQTTANVAERLFAQSEERFGDAYTVVDYESSSSENARGNTVTQAVDERTIQGVLQFDPASDFREQVEGKEVTGEAVFYTDDQELGADKYIRDPQGVLWNLVSLADVQRVDQGVEVYRKFVCRRADQDT